MGRYVVSVRTLRTLHLLYCYLSVSKVEGQNLVQSFDNWGPRFTISFDLMILEEAKELKSIFALMSPYFVHVPQIHVPQILLDGRKLRFVYIHNTLTGEMVNYETEVERGKWVKILVESKPNSDNTEQV